MSSLSIKRLKLHDYRCFSEIEIDFHEQLTVLVASNGAGKTSILDAIAVALGPFVGAFDEGTGKRFEASDIRLSRVRKTASNEMEYAPDGVWLEAIGHIGGSAGPKGSSTISAITWQRSLAGPVKATTVKDAKPLIDFGKALQHAVRRSDPDVALPLLAYYGTGRLWQQRKLRLSRLPRTSRTIGYGNCLNPSSSYKSMVEWFRYWSTNALNGRISASEAKKTYKPTEFDDYIESVSTAVNVCLAPAGWKQIAYSLAREELVARHSKLGELPVELLSDGIRNMIGMVADIAFRATKLNPQLGAQAAKRTSGIVLIDEVDMHLHPEWQQIVLQNLTKAFPKLQFIVSTHSPQVLSAVHRDSIRVIGPDATGRLIAERPLAMTYGEPSGSVLHSVMMVDPQPPVAEKKELQRLTELIDQGRYEDRETKRLYTNLLAKLGDAHPQLQRLIRSIRRQEALSVSSA